MFWIARRLLLLLLMGSAWMAAAAPTAPGANELLAQARVAAGGSAWDHVAALEASGQIRTSGLDGRWLRVEDLLESHEEAGFLRTSAAERAYYAHRQNKFWKILHETRLTPEPLQPHQYRSLLQHGIGLTDLVKAGAGMDRATLPKLTAADRARSARSRGRAPSRHRSPPTALPQGSWPWGRAVHSPRRRRGGQPGPS